tara:strand:- start:186 stop:398 length:213 start_codon:yes stop_codon:yes gene_type:complete
MKELLRTNDVTKIIFARAVLSDSGIPSFELDVNISIMEGSIGIFPRRLMVGNGDFTPAKRLMQEFGIQTE